MSEKEKTSHDADATIPPSDSPEPFLDTTPHQHVDLTDSKQIGRYKLLQQIGEGGMGTVWMADQQKPLQELRINWN